VLGFQSIPYSLRSVPLLAWLRLIIQQDLVDDAQPRAQLRTLYRLLAPLALRQRKLQHPNRLSCQAELPCGPPDTHTIHLHCSPHPRIHFHPVHLHGVSQTQLVYYVLILKVWWSTFPPPQTPLTRRFVVY
jgi:hypothetical protein